MEGEGLSLQYLETKKETKNKTTAYFNGAQGT
jgi:hypothetical protein